MFWIPPSNNQINSNTNPYRSMTTEQLRQNAQKMWQEASEKKLKDQYTWDAKSGKYVRIDGKKTKFDDLTDQYTWDEKTGKYVRIDGQTGIVAESNDLTEGGVKAALEDWMYSIPKAAIEELKPVMKIKNLTKRFAMITKVLKKHGFNDKFMGSMPANVVNDYFDTFFGESAELDEAHAKDIVKGITDMDGPFTVVAIKNNKVIKQKDTKMRDALPAIVKTMRKEVGSGVTISIEGKKGILNTFKEDIELDEVSPPGWEGTVKAMKKKKEIDNPWALAWWMKGKGYKSHRKADGTKKESVEIGEAREAFPSENDLKIWYKETGAVSPFEGAVPTYKNLKNMWKRAKTQAGEAWKIWEKLVKKGTVSESVGVQEAKTASSTMVNSAMKAVMKNLHDMSKKPNRDYERIADAIENWLKKKTRANFDGAVKLVVPYVEDVIEELEFDNYMMFTDDQIVDIAEIVVERHAKHMGESVQNDCGCGDTIEESHTRAELEKLSITSLRGLMKEYEKKASKGDRDAARELADIRGILRSRGAGVLVDEETLHERSIADLAAEMIPVKFRAPSNKPKKVTAIKLVLPDNKDIRQKMKNVMDKDASYRRKMFELVIDREERDNGELVLYFASFRGRENFSKMMNDASK